MRRFFLLFVKELRFLFFSKAGILFFLLLTAITGYSFYSAVTLYGNASAGAVNNPLYAAGFEPIPGVFVPTFGAVYMLFSLFLPFVIIPSVVTEKRQNTIQFLLQVSFSETEIVVAKAGAALLFVFGALAVPLTAVPLWLSFGGHLSWLYLFTLLFGYVLYGVFVVSVSLLGAALFSTVSAASIATLTVILLSWVIDFGKDMNLSRASAVIADASITAQLHMFEDGIFSVPACCYLLALSTVFLLLFRFFAGVTGEKRWIAGAVLASALFVSVSVAFPLKFDVTESRRHSFPKPIATALKQLPPVTIAVYLRPTDSRFKDYDATFLQKLLMIKRDVTMQFISGKALDDSYGLFVYTIGNRSEKTYSNSEEEIFPILFSLAGQSMPVVSDGSGYSGWPLQVTKSHKRVIIRCYFIGIPLLLLITVTGVIVRRRRRKRR